MNELELKKVVFSNELGKGLAHYYLEKEAASQFRYIGEALKRGVSKKTILAKAKKAGYNLKEVKQYFDGVSMNINNGKNRGVLKSRLPDLKKAHPKATRFTHKGSHRVQGQKILDKATSKTHNLQGNKDIVKTKINARLDKGKKIRNKDIVNLKKSRKSSLEITNKDRTGLSKKHLMQERAISDSAMKANTGKGKGKGKGKVEDKLPPTFKDKATAFWNKHKADIGYGSAAIGGGALAYHALTSD